MRPLLALALLLSLSGGPASAAATHRVAGRPDLVRAIEVLHDWDVRRAGAWAARDEAGLRALYVHGSGAGRADLRLLRAYDDRGLVVRTLRTQVFAVEVLRSDAWSLRLRVFDRVAGGEVLDGGRSVPLPSSLPVVRLVDLRHVRGTWRVVAVVGTATGRVTGWVTGWAPAPRAGPPRRRGR